MATVTLQYDVDAGNAPGSVMLAKVSAVDLFRGELDLLGMSLNSDNTIAVGSTIRRTIVLNVDAQGQSLFPTDAAKKDATRNLYRSALNLGAAVRVTAAEPVVT